MQLPYRQQRLLRRIEHTLRRSDPELAAMLAVFARLHADEVLVSPEQPVGVRVLARLLGAIACLTVDLAARVTTCVSACVGALSHLAVAAWRMARGHLGATQHSRARAA
jgi:hypothetical protein